MLTFTIENETNNITAHATAQEADAVPNAERFRNEAGLAKLAADWPAARLVEIYNSLPGVSPVKKFTDRKTAVSRIWKAIQSLRESLPGEPEAPAEVQTDVTATPVRCATNGRRSADGGTGDQEGHPVEKVTHSGPKGQGAPRRQQDGPGGRHAPAQERRHAGRDHGQDGLAAAHRARLRGRRDYKGRVGAGRDRSPVTRRAFKCYGDGRAIRNSGRWLA
jgi:hypothetical protein